MNNNKYDLINIKEPLEVHLQLVNKCTSKCYLCPYTLDNNTKEMNKNELNVFLTKIKSNNISHIYISGGNPLLHKYFDYFITELIKNNISVSLRIPLCLEINKHSIVLNNANIQIFIYIDENSLENMGLLPDKYHLSTMAKNNLAIIFDINKLTFPHIFRLAKTFKEYNLILQHTLPFRKNHIPYCYSDEKSKEIFAKIKKINSKTYLVSELFNTKTDTWKFCGAGIFKITVLPNGDVIPCEYILNQHYYICGNILKNSIHSMWCNKNMNLFRKHVKSGVYSACLNCTKINYCSACPILVINDVLKKNDSPCTFFKSYVCQ